MKPYVIETDTLDGMRWVGEYEDLKSARAAVADLEPGVYCIIHVVNPRVEVSPPEQPKRNVVDFGETTVKRAPKADSSRKRRSRKKADSASQEPEPAA